ncbi:MAG: mobB [Stygiobacter sp.]|nr:MAG: mobB [Stygiobacter sp.]
MDIFGIAGWSGSGKTTLITALLPVFTARGVVVATVKHTHHHPGFGGPEDLALGESGAVENVVASPRRLIVVHEHGQHPQPALPGLLKTIGVVDLILVEGFKFSPHPRLEVWDEALAEPLLALADSTIKAVVADSMEPSMRRELAKAGKPCFRRQDVADIAGFIRRNCMNLYQFIC